MNEEILKLTDVINERVAELIQIGFNSAARAKLGASRDVEAPMTIIEKRGDFYYRIPEGPLIEWTGFCTYLRNYTLEDGTKPCDELCRACDAARAEEFFSGGKRKWEWYICHAGLVDIAIPITVGGKVLAVFFGGQKRLKDDPTYSAKLSQKIKDLAGEVPGLEEQELMQRVREVPELTEAEIQDYADRVSEIVSHIGDLARRNYEARKTVAVMGRFSEEYMLRRRPLAEVLVEILQEVAEFLSVERVIIVRDTVQDPIVSSHPLSSNLTGNLDIANDLLAAVLKRAAIGKTTLLKKTDEPELIGDIAGVLELSSLETVFVKPSSFAGGTKGVFLYANPHLANWELASEEIMTQRKEFLLDLSERLRVQIDMYELDKEKDDLMAEVTHRLKSPMQWLMSETSTLLPRLEFLKKWRDFDPEIQESLEKIESIIHFLDAQTQNFTIIATMDKEDIAYDMKAHPLGKLVECCCDHYALLAQERDIELKVVVKRGCYRRSLLDWQQVEIAINNLLDNAIKYSHAKQTVFIIAQLDEVSNSFSVKISSFGVGIAEGEREAIFEKFRRGKIMKDPRRFIPGTGIGLTVARRIAKDHGGDIRLLECFQGPSEAGRGYSAEGWKVVFELTLPLDQENERTNNG